MPFDVVGSDPVPPSDTQLLLAARGLIAQPYCWTQHVYSQRTARAIQLCAVAAISVACDNQDMCRPTRRERRLARLLVREMPRRGGVLRWLFSSRSRVIVFNDRRSTKHADVLALFDRAIDQQRFRAMRETDSSLLYGF